MRFPLALALTALPLFVVAAEDQQSPPSTLYSNAHEAFQDLLNALPEESLQAALGSLTKFKAGVFESHRRGVQRVHDDNPPLATRLIVEAVRDLTRRQAPAANGTSTDTQSVATPPESSQAPPPQSSQAPPQSSQAPPASQPPASNPPASDTTTQQPPASNPPPTTNNPPATTDAPPPTTSAAPPTSRAAIVPIIATTTKDGKILTETKSVLSQVTASVQVTVTKTNDQGATITTAEFKPAVIHTTTDAEGRASAVTSAANFAPTKGEVITATNEKGSTFLTTYTPDGGSVQSIALITTTDAEGKPSTITSYAYVDPTAEGGADATESVGGAKGTGKPVVQSGAGRVGVSVVGVVAMLCAAVL